MYIHVLTERVVSCITDVLAPLAARRDCRRRAHTASAIASSVYTECLPICPVPRSPPPRGQRESGRDQHSFVLPLCCHPLAPRPCAAPPQTAFPRRVVPLTGGSPHSGRDRPSGARGPLHAVSQGPILGDARRVGGGRSGGRRPGPPREQNTVALHRLLTNGAPL